MGGVYSHRKVWGDLTAEDQGTVIECIKGGFDMNSCSSSGESLLRISLERGIGRLFEFLYTSRALLCPQLPCGMTILHRAVELNHYSLSQRILRNPALYGDLISSQDELKRTPLHMAVKSGNPDLVALLLKYNANRYLRDVSGKTPVKLALETNSPESDDIIEQFSIEDAIIQRESLNPHSSVTEPHIDLASALAKNRIPLIKLEELEFLEILNRGPQCAVYKGKWRGSDICIKQYELSNNLSSVLQQIQVQSRLRHPNLLLIMGVSINATTLCVVTEYIHYGPLSLSKTMKLPLTAKLTLAYSVAKGIAFLHTNSPPIVHRNIQPGNVLLAKNFGATIAGFSLAAHVASGEHPPVYNENIRFRAPELFARDSLALSADIWAFGCLLLELFSNQRPWAHIPNADSAQIFYEVSQKKPLPIPDQVPGHLRSLISSCCKYNPERRPTILEVLQELKLMMK